MKSIFTFLTIMLFVCNCAIANSNTNKNECINKNESVYTPNNNNILGTIRVDMDEVTFPWTISVPAPLEDIVDFEGPCGPNAAVMTTSNGMINITFKNNAGILELYSGGTYYINLRTHDFKIYVIELEII